jgi:hypothetical protein
MQAGHNPQELRCAAALLPGRRGTGSVPGAHGPALRAQASIRSKSPLSAALRWPQVQAVPATLQSRRTHPLRHGAAGECGDMLRDPNAQAAPVRPEPRTLNPDTRSSNAHAGVPLLVSTSERMAVTRYMMDSAAVCPPMALPAAAGRRHLGFRASRNQEIQGCRQPGISVCEVQRSGIPPCIHASGLGRALRPAEVLAVLDGNQRPAPQHPAAAGDRRPLGGTDKAL